MSFANRIQRLPRAHDPDRGQEAAEAAPWAQGDLSALLVGAGGSSPYLLGLLQKESDWLDAALDDPEAALKAVADTLRETPAAELPVALRQAKRRVALMTALADLAGVWPLETVTSQLTDFADLATTLAMRASVAAQARRGKLPDVAEDDPTCGGLFALAMGKMGAHELNYSSDVDLICLFDETRFDPADFHDARSGFVRATRAMCAMLSDLTGDGYVFRTDLRLRPDPSVTPVVLAAEAAERYYESLGRTWERAAYIKARPCAGDLDAGNRFLETLKPFVWRKHLDFAAIQDAHDMRLRIREHKGLSGPITLPGHNMKLGRGGIREIEFFTQTRQIISGGRDPSLRLRGTVEALAALAERDWVPQDVADTLTTHYRAHREVEHRVQMIHDAQTHDLPGSDDGFDRLAALMGTDTETLKADLRARLEEVHTLTERFFAREAGDSAAPAPETALEDHPLTENWPRYPALRSARAVEIFKRLKPEILGKLSEAARPEEALLAFDGFLSGLPAGVQLFSLFEANPQLVDLLTDITGTAPALSAYLARNSQVFDAVIGGDFFDPWPGPAALVDSLNRALHEAPDYERRLEAARRWGKEWHFRVGVHLLRELISAEEAGAQYADLAEAMLKGLWPVVVEEFARKHGPPPGRGAVVLGMGSLGAARLHARSDLDLILIYDAQGEDGSDGPRPLATRPYFARLTQAFITAVTAPMAEGRVYEIDMRLRPSGHQGPVATSLESFRNYQTDEAWLWEHLALTKARTVAGTASLGADVEAFRIDLLGRAQDRDSVLTEVSKMRARIAAAKQPAGQWDPKIGPGRMQDIELVAQAGALLVEGKAPGSVAAGLSAAQACGWLSEADCAHLGRTYDLLWTVQTGRQLVLDGDTAQDPGQGGAAFLCRLTDEPDAETLLARIDNATTRAAAIIDAALPPPEDSDEKG